MAEPRPLARPPIREAVIDFQVEIPEGATVDSLEAAFASPPRGYARKGLVTEGVFSLALGPDGQTASSSAAARAIGLRFDSGDGRYVAQFRLNGFSLSRLPPYENWEMLQAEAMPLWDLYLKAMKPTLVRRVATRYINDLQLPMENGSSFQDYLLRFADLPPEMPQTVAAFSQRFLLVDRESGARVSIGLALDPPFAGPRVPVILDVDAFQPTQLEPADPRLWQMLAGLRLLKNRCFFSTLTDRAVELYQ
ncbi:MAG: TIGR04255 family protein [Steroidobacteraceae bacterium]|nr:TIGR04255 family protein [Steroidobacteraceae bacterium]